MDLSVPSTRSADKHSHPAQLDLSLRIVLSLCLSISYVACASIPTSSSHASLRQRVWRASYACSASTVCEDWSSWPRFQLGMLLVTL
jgi:hypothetical protein